MSYILDALQRSHAERERAKGQAPSLHIALQPVGGSVKTKSYRGLIVAVVGAGLLIAAGIGWLFRGNSHGVENTAVSPPAVAVATASVSQPQPPSMVATEKAASNPTPAPMPSAASAPQEQLAPPRVATTDNAPLSKTARRKRSAPSNKAAVMDVPEPLRTVRPPPSQPARGIAGITINASVYSDDPSQRLLVVNGQPLREGARVTPDLELLQIGPHSAEFNYQGKRIQLPIQ